MAPNQPLRTALIGLSSSAKTSWASGAHLPAFTTPTGRSKLQITALLNSSEAAAKTAISTYGLPSSTKAYGDPQSLANDPDIDLVICNTRVDRHYETIIPSVRAGKDVFVEWPIASNKEHIDEIVKTAKEKGGRVAVGLQRRQAPQVLKIKEVIESGKLGKVLSSDVRIYGGTNDREILPTGLKYFADRKIGGNVIVVGFGHVFDFVQSVVGNLVAGTEHSRAQLQRPDVKVRDPETGKIVETIKSDVPDLLSVHGELPESSTTASAATASFYFRRGQPFPGTPPLTWTVNLERGEVKLVSPSGLALGFSDSDPPVTIQVHHFDTDSVEDVPWEFDAVEKEVSEYKARSVAKNLYAFADGAPAGEGWVSVEDAAFRASQIDGYLNEWSRN